jgi:hypothetical protein
MKLLAGLLIAYVLLPPFELEAHERGRIKWKSPTEAEADRLASESEMSDNILRSGDIVVTDHGFFMLHYTADDQDFGSRSKSYGGQESCRGSLIRTTEPVQAGCTPERAQAGWILGANTKSGWIGSHEDVRGCVRRYPGWSTQACSRPVVK